MTGDQVIARLFFEMTRVIHKTYMPDTRFGTFLDLVPVGYAIFLGQAEGRPMGLTGLARFLDIPRSAVQPQDRRPYRTRDRRAARTKI
jgi:hypothetical protein